MDAYFDPRADIDAFFDHVWNSDTAQGLGLDIWGRIVGVQRALHLPNAGDTFGFSEGANTPFSTAPFRPEGVPETSTYLLSDAGYRQLILVKAIGNISNGTAPAINQLLQNLFAGRGRAYVNDIGSMQIRYTFEFVLTQYETAIANQSGAIPHPAGVRAFLLTTPPRYFGFSEGGGTPFDAAPFIPEGSLYAIL